MILFYLLYFWVVFQLLFPAITVVSAQLFGGEKNTHSTQVAPDFACIITAYKNADIALPLIDSLLRQTYQNFHIYLVADECPDFAIEKTWPKTSILQPDSPLRLKIKSIQYAFEHFTRPHTHTIVFDADNLAHPAFLFEIAAYVQRGFQCVQGRRTAKNTDTSYAAADSLGEIYKNYIERYAPYLLGGSAVISGSGMATQTALYQEYLQSKAIQDGQQLGKKMLQEDKILQHFLLQRNIPIAFAWNAICYDEKTSTGEAVQIQRSRWIFSYFQNIPNALELLWLGIRNLSPNQFFFGIVTLALPMFIQLTLAVLLGILAFWIGPEFVLSLTLALGVFAFNILWVLHLSKAPKAVWRAILMTPWFMAQQILALSKLRNPNKNFQPTQHQKAVSLDDILEP